MSISRKFITESELKRIMPRCKSPGMWAEILSGVMEKFNINTILRTSAFLAMCAQQSRDLTKLSEQCSKERANFLYANKYGNRDQVSGDGWKFRGRGLFMLTGRSNYRRVGTALNLPLEEQPELLERSDLAALSAAFFWQSHGLNQLADANDFQKIKRCIDGRNYGLDEAEKYWKIAQMVISESNFQGGKKYSAKASEDNQFTTGVAKYLAKASGDHQFTTGVAKYLAKNHQLTTGVAKYLANTSEDHQFATSEKMEHQKNSQVPETSTIDPPRSAYAVLDCPDSAVAEQKFKLVVGFGKEQSPNTTGDRMIRPTSSVGPYNLTIQVVADGFKLRTGESWRRELMVTAEAPYPTVEFHLKSESQKKKLQPRIIQAMFSVDGQTMGVAFRPITVVKKARQRKKIDSNPVEPGIDVSIPTDKNAPDLTIRILEDVDRKGGLLWGFDSPHADIIASLSHEPIKTHIGDNPQAFTRSLINQVNLREGRKDLAPLLRGIGKKITGKMPTEFWTLFTALIALSKKEQRIPTVLLLSQEPYIPWELAVVEPLLDLDVPPFLSAQVNLGRWVLGQLRPKLPPPASIQVQTMTVVSGVYGNTPGWNRLVAAEEEAQELHNHHGAIPVNADLNNVLECLIGNPLAEVLHFAVHGIYDPQGVQQGLVLVDRTSLDPTVVEGLEMKHTPFVFLNACQVGAGNQILGDYAGMAAAFLYADASGVIAPVWSVKDRVAKEIALRFYNEMQKTEGVTPADFLRLERKNFQQDNTSGTCLAYQFFGHPCFKLQYADKLIS